MVIVSVFIVVALITFTDIINTVVSGKVRSREVYCVLWCGAKHSKSCVLCRSDFQGRAEGEGLTFPCHVTATGVLGFFITDLTSHDGNILLSLIVMKCKLSPAAGDNRSSSRSHCNVVNGKRYNCWTCERRSRTPL